MIETKQITKKYGDLEVLKGINVKIDKGEIVTIVGPSGAGKTTLLQIIGTLSQPTEGELWIADVAVQRLKSNDQARFRNQRIGFIFQFHHLLPEFSAFENVCIPGFIAQRNKKEVAEKAHDLLNYLGLDNRLHHKPSEMSGGEQQRVAVARALMNDPDVILADEPSGNLDFQSKRNLHNLFFELRDRFGQTFVIVTHNKELAQMSDRMLSMKDGLISDQDFII